MTDNSCVESQRKNDYFLWVEQAWWTSQEACCVFLGYAPDKAHNLAAYRNMLSTSKGRHIQQIIDMAIADGSIKNLIIEPNLWRNRAPCKDWLEWALSKPSIHLDPLLLESAGISFEKNSRTDESYRPKDEKLVKFNFRSLAKLILYLCPNARLKDITQIIESSNAIIDLPCDRTLRKWLSHEQISLFSSKQTDDEIDEIQKKLTPILHEYSPFETPTQLSES
jgi:hypothetical protein